MSKLTAHCPAPGIDARLLPAASSPALAPAAVPPREFNASPVHDLEALLDSALLEFEGQARWPMPRAALLVILVSAGLWAGLILLAGRIAAVI